MFDWSSFAVVAYMILLLFIGFMAGKQYENRRMSKLIAKAVSTLSQKECCETCVHYDGRRCTKDWNNLDPAYYIPDRDDVEPWDHCEDYEYDKEFAEE